MTATRVVAPAIFARIDTNRDGLISEAEGQAYARRVLNEIIIEVDGLRIVHLSDGRVERVIPLLARGRLS